MLVENTLLKTACHCLLLLVGFDTLTYRKDYDRSPILVGHEISCLSECIRAVQTWFHEPRLCNIFMPLSEITFLLCGRFIDLESLPVVGFSHHVDATGVFGVAHDHTCPNVLVREGGVCAANQAIRLCGFITFT